MNVSKQKNPSLLYWIPQLYKKPFNFGFLNATYRNILSSITSHAHYYRITGDIHIQKGGKINEASFSVIKISFPFQHVRRSKGCATERQGFSDNFESQSKRWML